MRYCSSGNVRGDLLAVLAMTMVMAAAPALAFPEGAPWGAANPDSDENCGTCHFGYDATRDAKSLSVKGLPEIAVPGSTYELEISFDDADAAIAGFQLLATDGEVDGDDGALEYLGAAIRSTKPATADAGFDWSLSWTAPDKPGVHVMIYVAVVAGNDDLSPFGDRAFFRTFETRLEPD